MSTSEIELVIEEVRRWSRTANTEEPVRALLGRVNRCAWVESGLQCAGKASGLALVTYRRHKETEPLRKEVRASCPGHLRTRDAEVFSRPVRLDEIAAAVVELADAARTRTAGLVEQALAERTPWQQYEDMSEAERMADLNRLLSTGQARDIREEAKVMQLTMAKSIGVSAAVFSRWENGERHPDPRFGDAYHQLLVRLQEQNSFLPSKAGVR